MVIDEKYFIYVSISIVVLYLVFMIIGYKKGFLYELVSLGYTFISILISWMVSPTLASLYPIIDINSFTDNDLIDKLVNINPIINTIAYFIIIFLFLKLFYLVLSLILKGLNKLPVIGKLNQILGLFAGIINATVVTLAISMLFTLPLFKNGNDIRNKTILMFIDKYSMNALNYVVEKIDINKIKNTFSDIDLNNIKDEFKVWFENNIDNE